MAYDIYGNHLRKGYCEVHPDVPEKYPCSYCYDERDEIDYYQKIENSYCADMQNEYENEMIRQFVFDMFGINTELKLLTITYLKGMKK